MKVTIDAGAFLPVRAHADDAGLDILSPVDMIIRAGQSAKIDTGVHVALKPGTVGMIKSRSGLNLNRGIVSEGVIDAGYTGAIRVKLYNHSTDDYNVRRGDRITQLVVLPCIIEDVEIVDTLDATERGNGGFGSTGR